MAKSKNIDRPFDLRWLDPKTLKPNPQNWRSHPEEQTKLLSAVLGEVGWAGVALYNETTGRLIDGHARRDWAIEHGQDMPVLVGRWSENDEKKILATLDPLAGIAERMDDMYRELVQGIETENPDLSQWLQEFIQEIYGDNIPDDNKDIDEDKLAETNTECPQCGFRWQQ